MDCLTKKGIRNLSKAYDWGDFIALEIYSIEIEYFPITNLDFMEVY